MRMPCNTFITPFGWWLAHQASRLVMPPPLSLHAAGLYMRFWWVNFVDLGVMYANLVFAESRPCILTNHPQMPSNYVCRVISPYLGLVTHIFIQFLTAQPIKILLIFCVTIGHHLSLPHYSNNASSPYTATPASRSFSIPTPASWFFPFPCPFPISQSPSPSSGSYCQCSWIRRRIQFYLGRPWGHLSHSP